MKPGRIMIVTAGLSILLLVVGSVHLQELLKINQMMIIGTVLVLWAVACICSSIFAKSKFEKMIYIVGLIFLLVGGLFSIFVGLILMNNGVTF